MVFLALSEDELFDIICCLEHCKKVSTKEMNASSLLNTNISATEGISRIEFTMLARSLKGFIQLSDEQRFCA